MVHYLVCQHRPVLPATTPLGRVMARREGRDDHDFDRDLMGL